MQPLERPAQDNLRGISVLVVEDDYFIASEICGALSKCEAHIVGPAPDIRRALQLLNSSTVHCAVLDINLHGDLAFELAEEVERLGVPLIFATGYSGGLIPERLAAKPRLEKPINLDQLLSVVLTATRSPAGTQ
jgi:two-component SAPR family response regulator